ncbi:MAG: succinylglutamate desuccinylase/aspartoacylase family protein [Planctomycetota bacterium]|nr:succinylglutamate desuccinylase/aspartoacylase family protein [Planctomycetota bacterium]
MIESLLPIESASAARGLEVPRLLGRVDRGVSGPLLVLVGGLHGNEPAGVRAARRVLEELGSSSVPLCGRVVALSGNRQALRVGERYLSRDLNRVWRMDELAALRRGEPAVDAEAQEQRELLAALEAEVDDWDGPLSVLDLHTTSGGGGPFTLAADTLQNRTLSERMPLPMVLGIEEGIEGPLLSYLADRGVPALVVEGGLHDDARTEERLVAAIWSFLEVAGAVGGNQPQVVEAHALLRADSGAAPSLLEVVHVHSIADGDDYRTLAGFDNFSPIEVGQHVANDRRGAIRSPRSGHMLMPLYQPLGQDGFFLCREISPAWLRFSERCRRSGLESLLSALPGVRTCHEVLRCYEVDDAAPKVVRRVLRHFGYCKEVPGGRPGSQRVVRRPERDEHA